MAITRTENRPSTEEELLALVKQDPHRPGRAYGRLVEHERSVWGLMLFLMSHHSQDDPLQATDEQIQDTADAFDIPEIAVRAALAYYKRNRRYVDALLTLQTDTGADE
jgi:hypothetical protein